MRPLKSPHSRTHLTVSGERLRNGRKIAERTRAWMEGHESEVMTIYKYVKGLQFNNEKGRTRDKVAAYCVDNKIAVGGDPYAFDNTLWAGISRYLVMYDKSLDGAPLTFRDSDIDCYGILPVSYLDLEKNYE